MIHKRPNHDPFFAKNPFSPTNKFVFTGLVGRTCHFDVRSSPHIIIGWVWCDHQKCCTLYNTLCETAQKSHFWGGHNILKVFFLSSISMVPLQIQASSWYYLTFILNSRFWLAEQTIKKCMLFEHDTMRFKLFSSWDSCLTWKDSDFLWTRDSGLRMQADFNRLSFELPNFLDLGKKGKSFLNSCKNSWIFTNVRTLLKNIKIFFSILCFFDKSSVELETFGHFVEILLILAYMTGLSLGVDYFLCNRDCFALIWAIIGTLEFFSAHLS